MTEDGLSLPHFQNNNCTVRDEASETEKQGGEGRKKESEGGRKKAREDLWFFFLYSAC